MQRFPQARCVGLAGTARARSPDWMERELPAALAGTPRDVAEKIRLLRDTYGVTSFSLQHHHAEFFGKVIAELR